VWGVVVLAIGAAAAAAGGFGLGGGRGPAPGAAGLPPATAQVTRTTLTQTEQVSGSLGYGDPVSLAALAYFPTPNIPGTLGNNFVAGGPDWCSAQVHLNKKDGTLWTTCQDNGVLMLKFTNGVWPLPGSNTQPGQQN